MKNRVASREPQEGPQPIGEILAELLAQYQIRFPEVRLSVVETPAASLVMEDYHACACPT